jgi:5-methylcytosine-specific restriction enzyme A
MALLKLCGCGKRISAELKRCEACDLKRNERHKEYDNTRRNKERASFYSSKLWATVRNKVAIRDKQLCQLCLSQKRFKKLQLIHHIKTLEEFPELGTVESNLIGLCSACHGRVHEEYKTNKQTMESLLKSLIVQNLSFLVE